MEPILERDEHFDDMYRRYKKSTDVFTQWLALTAGRTGTVDDVLNLSEHGLDNDVPTGRRRGKARKLRNKNVEQTTEEKPYRIPTKHYIQLATAIAMADSITVSKHVFTILRSIIQDRQAYGDWYNRNISPEHDGSDSGDFTHKHFVDVLKAVLTILVAKDQSAAVDDLRVEVEEDDTVSQDWSQAYDIVQKEVIRLKTCLKHCRSHINCRRYEMEETDWDTMVAITDFLREATRIRAYSQYVWHEFKDTKIGLQAAGQTMNAAISLIRDASDEFLLAHPQFSGSAGASMHDKIIGFIKRLFPCNHCKDRCCKGRTFIEEEQQQEILFGDNYGSVIVHPSLMLCTELVELLEQYFGNPGQIPDIVLYKHEQIFIWIMGAMGHAPKEFPVHSDIVYEAISNIKHNTCKDTWMVYALQMVWDSQYALDDHIESAVLVLRSSVLEAIRTYTSCMDTMDPRHAGRANSMQRETYGKMKKYLKRCRAIEIHTRPEALKAMKEATGPSPKVLSSGFSYSLLLNPGLCAMTLVDIWECYEDIVLGIINKQGSIMAAAHLYNAILVTEDYCPESKWEDMEYFLAEQDCDRILIVAEPQCNTTLFDNFMLAMGASPFGLAKLSKKSYLTFTDCAKLFAPDQALSLRRLTWDPELLRENCGIHLPQRPFNVLELREKIPRPEDAPPGSKVSNLFVVDAFKKVVHENEIALTFNLAEFHIQCVKFLRKALGEDLPAFNEMSLQSIVEHFIAIRSNIGTAPLNIGLSSELAQFFEEEGCALDDRSYISLQGLEERVKKEEGYKFEVANWMCCHRALLKDRIVLPGETAEDVVERMYKMGENSDQGEDSHP